MQSLTTPSLVSRDLSHLLTSTPWAPQAQNCGVSLTLQLIRQGRFLALPSNCALNQTTSPPLLPAPHAMDLVQDTSTSYLACTSLFPGLSTSTLDLTFCPLFSDTAGQELLQNSKQFSGPILQWLHSSQKKPNICHGGPSPSLRSYICFSSSCSCGFNSTAILMFGMCPACICGVTFALVFPL